MRPKKKNINIYGEMESNISMKCAMFVSLICRGPGGAQAAVKAVPVEIKSIFQKN